MDNTFLFFAFEIPDIVLIIITGLLLAGALALFYFYKMNKPLKADYSYLSLLGIFWIASALFINTLFLWVMGIGCLITGVVFKIMMNKKVADKKLNQVALLGISITLVLGYIATVLRILE